MYEYKTFAYLDVQKTASRFIVSVFDKFCKEDAVKKDRHASLAKDYDPSKFYFLSVRDPLDQYISLYSFGCLGKGQVSEWMRRLGLGQFYDQTWSGFECWLECILDPANSEFMGSEYHTVSKWIGWQSYRVLRLAIPDFHDAAANCRSKDDLKRLYDEMNVVGHVIRYENLRDDLCSLITDKLSYCMRSKQALRYARNAPPLNASDRVDRYMATRELGPKIRKLLERREWLLDDTFGYGPKATRGTGRATGRSLESPA